MKICVVGTGTMGNGIAQTFAQAGHDVLLKGRSEASLGKERCYQCPHQRHDGIRGL